MGGFNYGIENGTYVGVPTSASCYEKDGKLILDIKFALRDPATGDFYKNDKGYNCDFWKRHWLTNNDGAFNEATINGIKEWAKGWNPQSFDDFYWFQKTDENGTPFGNLVNIGEVEINLTTDNNGNQQMWVHDPNRAKPARKAYVPEGATGDAATLSAKWGAKARALFAAAPKKIGSAVARPSQPAHAPTATAKPWASLPQNADGVFAFFCKKLEQTGTPYKSELHDEQWFAICDKVVAGKDPDQHTPQDIQKLFAEINESVK